MAKKTETTEQEQPASEASSQAGLLAVHELAEKHGHTRPTLVIDGIPDTPFSREHAMASVIHHWNLYSYLKGHPPTLSDADYLAALEAAKDGKAHEPAQFSGKHDHTKEQIEAKMKADKKSAEARRQKFRKPHNAAAESLSRAQGRAKFIKQLQASKKKRGV